MFCFHILSDFGENRKRGKLEKYGYFGFLHHCVGNPHHSVALRRRVGCLAVARPRCSKGAPWVSIQIRPSGRTELGGRYTPVFAS